MRLGRRSVLGLALLGGMQRVIAGSPASPAPRARLLDSELAAIATHQACELASLSVLAVRHGQVSYQKQFGQRVLASPGSPADNASERTLYRIASVSKMVTTLGAMLLVEQGKLALDNDVSDDLGFVLRNPHFPERPITLRSLLSHTSSLRDDGGYSWPASITLRSVLVPGAGRYGEGRVWSRRAAPGDYFEYCNLGWGLLGSMMERVTGERFDRLMKRLVLDPLGMQGGYNPAEFPPEDLANLATLYRKRTTDTEIWNPAGPWIAQADDYRGGPPPAPPQIGAYVIGANATPFSPTGGLRASAADLSKVMLMLINDGMHGGRRFLKSATLQRMFTRQWTFDGSNGDTSNGLYHCWGMGNQQFPDRSGTGMQLVEGGGFAGVGHLGDAYGLVSIFVVDLEKKNGMIVLIGGVGSDPALFKGRYSAMPRFQEQILSALHWRAIQGADSERL